MRVILFLLKCVVGFLASVGVIVIAIAIALSVAWERFLEYGLPDEEIPQETILALDLTQGVLERRPDSPFARASVGRAVVLAETVEALEAAGEDDRVRAVAVRLGYGDLGFAQAQELHDAVVRFRQSGKPAHAFAETIGGPGGGGGTVQAFLTSAFDEVWLQPSGDYGLSGFHLESPFLRGLLDEIGITPRLDQREVYKGFADRFTGVSMPEEQRENLQRLLDSWLAQVTAALAEARGMPQEEVRALVDRGPLRAQDALEAGLVDELGYRRQAEAALEEAIGNEVESIPLQQYAALREADGPEDAPRIAVIHGSGAVMLGDSEHNPVFGNVVMGADTVGTAITEAVEDDDVVAIVLRVDSPGGSYVGADAIWHDVRAAREAGKPVVVSMGNIAASGGYYVAAPASHIVAAPGTITGSIGVASGKFVLEGLWENLSINFEGVQAGEQADFWSPHSDFTEEQWAQFQGFLDDTYADFRGKVQTGRDLNDQEIERATRGRVWTGADALEVGLVDSLGGFRQAVEVARDLAEIPEDVRTRLVPFPEPVDPLRRFLQSALEGRIESPAAQSLARLDEVLAPVVDVVELLHGAQGDERLRAPDSVREAGGVR